MFDRFRGYRKPAAFVVGLVLASTVTMVAPAAASAREATQPAAGNARTFQAPAPKQAHDWNW